MKMQTSGAVVHSRAQPQKPLKYRTAKPEEEQIASFWLFYLFLLIGSIIPIVGVFPAFILFSFAKSKFFKFLPIVLSLLTSGYALYLRAHAGSVFQQLKNLVY
ncbi:hypothetical protein [Leptospira sarikeiensis]|uniref:Uncharacterized protein n=1 Tax=Leptospira sarikeiensis TaxID=2484943 RepID=A0A4R9K032_9LEPT|nr:hypothetical protein [Leptospira sarikeiensis]TGL58364.1 hypothetical protein EHQ64_18935 [Leptospira sarikeiensis]